MGYRVSLEKNTDIMSFVENISNCSMINNLIGDLINREGVANFFCNDDGSYSFSLITDKKERVYILFRDNIIYISNNLCDMRQQVIFKQDDSCISIRNTVSSKVDRGNHIECNTTESKTIYDSDYNLIYNGIVRSNSLSSDDPEINEKLKKIDFENYVVTSDDYIIGDKVIRTSFVDYAYNEKLNKKRYYVSDYVSGDGILDSLNFKAISENEFLDSYSDYIYDCEIPYVKIIEK